MPPDHPVWELWDAIRSAWPGPTTHWPDEPQPAWVYAIDDLAPQQIERGVQRMVREGGEFPPSAPLFRSLCLVAANWEHRRQETLANALPTPESVPVPPEEALKNIAAIKAMLAELNSEAPK